MGFFEVYLKKNNTSFVSTPVCLRSLKFPGFPVFLPCQKTADPSLMLLGKKQRKKKSLFSFFNSMSKAYPVYTF